MPLEVILPHREGEPVHQGDGAHQHQQRGETLAEIEIPGSPAPEKHAPYAGKPDTGENTVKPAPAMRPPRLTITIPGGDYNLRLRRVCTGGLGDQETFCSCFS